MNTVPFPIAIDSTMRAAFVSCPRKFQFEFLDGWARSEQSVHLVAGAAFARGCEVARAKFYGEHCSQLEALGYGIEALIKEYGEYEPPENSPKSLENMCMALADYFTVNGMATDLIQPLILSNKPCVEFTFALPIPNTSHPSTGEPILYCGRFDLLGIYNSGLWVVDEKTTTQLGQSWINNWKLRSQITGYCWAAREYGHEVAGGIIRGISILKNSFGHAESIQYRPSYMIERWLSQLQRDVARMIHCYNEGYFDYALDSACANFGGCPFLDVCSSRDPEVWLEADFVHRVWNPLSVD